MSNQDSKDWGGKEITEAFFDFLNFTRQSINFNLFGNKEPKYVWDSVFSGELTTSDMDVRISFSNPNDFFHIIEYVEKYIHNATGEHIWQNSLSKK